MSFRRNEGADRAASTDGASSATRAPGKRTRAEQTAVQAKRVAADARPAEMPSATGAGEPLPEATRDRMERSFGADFGDVRVHEGGEAPAIGAIAYTQGSHLHFAPGRYSPESASGQELIGHELAHVVQQRAGRVAAPQGKGAPINADPSLEREADEAGARAAAGRPAGIEGGGGDSTTRAAQPKLASPVEGSVVQRAVGFELEMPSWRSFDKKGGKLEKSTVIVDGPGFNLEADDQDEGEKPASDVEVVIDPPVTTLDQLEGAVKGAAKTVTTLIGRAGEDVPASDVGGNDGMFIRPQNRANASAQATVAVPLDRLPELFKAAGNDAEEETRLPSISKNPGFAVKRVDRRLKELGQEVSPELRGLLVLIVDYLLEAKTGPKQKDWPKGIFPIMARTTFTKMFHLIPEHKYFADEKHRAEFVKLIVDIAEVNEKDTALPQQFNDIEVSEGKRGKARLPTTVGQWIGNMPEGDLLSFGRDRNFEGMGYLGDKTDKLVEKGDKLVEKEDKLLEKDDIIDESLIEMVTSKTAKKAVEVIESKKKEKEKEIEIEIESSEEEKKPRKSKDKGKRKHKEKDEEVEVSKSKPAKEAPVFELRDIRTPGEPDAWLDYARGVFNAIEAINEGNVYQGPTKKRDPNKPKPPGNLSGDFKPVEEKEEKEPVKELLIIDDESSSESETGGGMQVVQPQQQQHRPRPLWKKLLCCFPFCCGCCD